MSKARVFYGWWVVAGSLVATMVGNALGLFGAGVYLHAIIQINNWPTSIVSGAITAFHLVSALLLIPVGTAIGRFGPRLVIAVGAMTISGGVVGLGHVSEPWQTYVAFSTMGIGWACLSTTAVAVTLSPWFEKQQGRAVSIASLGASAGGMISAPALFFGIEHVGFSGTTLIAGLLAIAIVFPIAGFVMKHRPAELGLWPDGERSGNPTAAPSRPRHTGVGALRTWALRSVMITFGIAMMVQIGFLTHQVTMISAFVGASTTSATVSATAVAALVGRIALARFADQFDTRTIAAIVLLLAAIALSALALIPGSLMMITASIVFGLTVGNVTTLSALIVRREFDAASFGVIFGIASCGIQLTAALGPYFFGLLHDLTGSYRPPLLVGAILDAIVAYIVLPGGRNMAASRPNDERPLDLSSDGPWRLSSFEQAIVR